MDRCYYCGDYIINEDGKGCLCDRAKENTIRLEERIKVLEGKYNELIFAVHNKYPNESRHETALRYIQSYENLKYNIAKCERTTLEVKP